MKNCVFYQFYSPLFYYLIRGTCVQQKGLICLNENGNNSATDGPIHSIFFLLHSEQNFLKDGAIWNGLAIVFKFGPDTPNKD